MAISDDIAALTTATNSLLAAVNVSKNTLDTSISNASAATLASAQIAAMTVGTFPNSAASSMPRGITSVTSLVGGSGGTNGSYTATLTGGGGTGAVVTYTVAGGSVTSVTITQAGYGYTSAPTIAFPAPNLTGASATLVVGDLVPLSRFYWASTADGSYIELYQNNAGSPLKVSPTVAIPSRVQLEKIQSISAPFLTYSALAAITGLTAGFRTSVLVSDTGNHTDPVVGGTVSNAGVYQYSTSPAGWQRIADLDSQLITDQANRLQSALGYVGSDTVVPYGVTARVDSYGATQASTVSRSTDGRWTHTGTGNTAFHARFKIGPSMAAEFAAGRSVNLVVIKESGTFSVNPYVDNTTDILSVVSGSTYTITLDAATYNTATEYLVRWTASQGSVVVGPHVLFVGQTLLAKNIATEYALKNQWAKEIADIAGNQVTGFAMSSIQDLPGDSVGTTVLSDQGRCLTVAGNESLTVETTCRGIVKPGSTVTMVYRVEQGGSQNEVATATLGISSNLTSAADAASTRVGGAAMGNLYILQRNVALTDSDSNGTPVSLTMLINNAVTNRTVFGNLSQVTVRLLGLFVTDSPVQPHKFVAIDEILTALEQRIKRSCVVDNTLVSDDYLSGKFRTIGAALRSSYGHIRLTDGQSINEPSGVSILRPVRITSERFNKPLVGGWENKIADSWLSNGDGTFSITLTHPFRNLFADQVTVERVAINGLEQWFAPAASKAAVAAATVGQFLSFYNTSTKELTINENLTDATYRVSAGHQRTFISVRCRSGKSPGEPVVLLENLDIRYSGGHLIHVDGESVLETRGCKIGRCFTDGIAIERSGWWRDTGEEPSVARYTGGNGFSTNTLVNIRPCRMSGSGPKALDNVANGFEFKGGGQTVVEFSGKIVTNNSGRRGVYVNAGGSYHIRAADIGANGLGNVVGGAFYCLVAAPTFAEINLELIKGDWIKFDDGVVATVENAILKPKQGNGLGIGHTYNNDGGTSTVQAISYIPDGTLNQDYR